MLTVVIVGMLSFDGASLLIGRVQAADKADSAAQGARDSYRQDRSVHEALAAAQVAAGSAEVLPRSLLFGPDGSVRVSVHRVAPTLLFRYITPLAKLADITKTGVATVPIR